MGSRYYPEIGFEYELEPMTDKEKPEAAVDIIAIGGLENSACFCQFADSEVTISEWPGLVLAKTLINLHTNGSHYLKKRENVVPSNRD